jgi:hypothetical protein
MSTLDPGLEPPGDWQNAYASQDPGPTSSSTAAAISVWLSAGYGLLMSGCCLLNAVWSALNSAAVAQQVPNELPPEMQHIDMSQMIQIMSACMGVVVIVLIFLPTLALTVLGFWVRKGHRGAIGNARVIVWLFSALACLGVLMAIFSGATSGQMWASLFLILLCGAWLAICIITAGKLKTAMQESGASYPNSYW